VTENGAPIGEDDLQAFIDGRLQGVRLDRVNAYIEAHPDAGERVAADRQIRDSLRAQLQGKFNEPIPTRLRIDSIRAARRARLLRTARVAAAAVVIFVAGGTGGWYAARLRDSATLAAHTNIPTTALVAQDATEAYRTYVVEVAHPVEVDAAHQAHLMQWLSKRLKRPLVAPDLSAFGYHLMGGRLLPAGTGAAAQLMYDDASGKRLTIYVQASHGTETAFRFGQVGNAATFVWIDQGFGFAVTAAEERNRLLPIAEAVYHSLSPNQSAVSGG